MQGHDIETLGSASFESTLIKKPQKPRGISLSALKEKMYPRLSADFFNNIRQRGAYVALHKAAAALTHSHKTPLVSKSVPRSQWAVKMQRCVIKYITLTAEKERRGAERSAVRSRYIKLIDATLYSSSCWGSLARSAHISYTQYIFLCVREGKVAS
jgi:hypothetical protein